MGLAMTGPSTGDHLAVVGGEVSKSGLWPAVVAIGANGKICTGSLLSPTLILTAAHCFKGLAKEDFPEVYVGQNLGSELLSIQYVKAWKTHPKYCGAGQCDIPKYDFAYIVLDKPVTLEGEADYAKLLVEPKDWSKGIQEQAPVWLVGFGKDDAGETGQKHHVETMITRVQDSGSGFFAGQEGKDSCDGDSGGPAYVNLGDNTWKVAGVLSAGSSPCGKGGYFVSAVDVAPWLRDEVNYQVNLACEDSACLRKEADAISEKGGCRMQGITEDGPLHPAWLGVVALFSMRRKKRALELDA